MKTEAIVAGEDHVARLQEMELPEMTATRVRIRTKFSGVSCGTETDCLTGRAVYMARPYVTGYQSVGEVTEVGRLVRSVSPGDLVYTNGGGLWKMRSLAGGSHARELVVEDGEAFRLSPGLKSSRDCSYACLAAIAHEGLSRLKPEPGRVLVVFGLGMLGQLVGRIGQLLGLRVIGVNRSTWKCDAAKALGFDAVCGPEEAQIRAAAGQMGFGDPAYAVDLTGQQSILDLALTTLGRFGKLSLLGYYPDRLIANFDTCHAKQIEIHNPVGPGERVPQVLRWMESGALNIDSLIRRTVKPSEITPFYADLVKNHSAHLGAVIDWNDA